MIKYSGKTIKEMTLSEFISIFLRILIKSIDLEPTLSDIYKKQKI